MVNGQSRGKADGAEGKVFRTGRRAVRLDGDEAHPVTGADAPVRRTTRRGREVRKRILEAALDCFSAFGFEGASTRAVAERAQVTHTLVLYHFQSKEQLWIATMDAALGSYADSMQEHLTAAQGKPAAEALRSFIERFIRLSAERPQLHRILTMESNQGTTRLDWVVEHYLRAHFETVTGLIRRAQQEGTVRQCDPARLYYMILGAGGTPFTVSTEYKALTGRDVFSETEILRNIAFLYELVFVDAP